MKVSPARLSEWAGEEVEDLLARLPPVLRERADDVAIVLQRRPTGAQVRGGVEPDLMGLFDGPAFAEEQGDTVPARLYLFLDNIWDEVEGDPEAFREEVQTTLLHELGHYLGLDEDDLAERELE